MEKIPQWQIAQVGEKGLWDGVIHHDYYILEGLADNSVRAEKLRRCLVESPNTCFEVGIGPFGLGLSAFLPEIPLRFAIDPLPPVALESSPRSRLNSTELIRSYMRQLRAPIHYVQGCGEEIPIRSGGIDLVICCNVLDHVSHPDETLREIHRVLRPGGQFFFNVDTFSMLGLVKWYAYTKYAHKDEILVTTHPYRMYESDVIRRLRSAGFALLKIEGHTFRSNLLGHARDSTFLGTKT